MEAGWTIPRVKGLVDSYKRRRGRELRELAIATHEPDKLNESYPQTGAVPARPGAPVLETKRWWGPDA